MASPSASPEVYGPVPSGRAASGRLAVPGSKSLTQRYFNLALLGRSPLVVHRPLLSEDTRNFLAGLEVTGFDVTHGVDRVILNPNERRAGEAAPSGDIWCGAGGTMFRFLTAALTTVPGAWRLDGIPRLRERTVAPLLAALRQLGAELHCPGGEGFAPLDIVGGSLRGGHAVLDSGVSSQFLSALLMAGTVTPEPVSVEVAALTSEPYVDLTLDAIAEMGGAVTREGQVFRVEGRRPAADAITVEADFSAVAYPAAAAALTGGRVHVESLSPASRQGDRGFVDLLTRMGAEVAWRDGGLEVAGGPLHAVTESLEATPDQVPTLAALAPFARGTTRILDVPHLRIKESDRLLAMATELRRVGAEVEELEDGLVIPGVWADDAPPRGPVTVDTWGDHRIAMAMALVGLRRPGISLRAPEVVGKSYPGFWRDLEGLIQR